MFAPILIFIFSFLGLSTRLFKFPLKNWDEAWYAEIIKQLTLFNRGWLVPFWNGRFYFDKPPLYFWLSSLITKTFGVGEWQVRLISVIAAAACFGLIYLIGRRFFSSWIGLVSVLVFASTGQVYRRFSEGNLDSLLVFSFLLSFYLFLTLDKKKLFVFLGISFFLGFLVKSWLLGFFPILLCLLYLPQFRYKTKFLVEAIIFSLCLYLVFIGLGVSFYGRAFFNWYLLSPDHGNFHNFALHLDSYFFAALIRDLGLWFLLALIGCLVARPKVNFQKLLPLLIVSFFYFVSLNFAYDRFDWYLLPIYPLLALVFSNFIADLKLPVLLIFLIQLGLSIYLIAIDTDRSLIGASLGLSVKKLVSNETVILDDQDFTSFLYYSDLSQIYVYKDNGGQTGEWWIINSDQLDQITRINPSVAIITKNPERFHQYSSNLTQIYSLPFEYKFLKITTSDLTPVATKH